MPSAKNTASFWKITASPSKEETPKEDAPEESHDADETGDSSSEN